MGWREEDGRIGGGLARYPNGANEKHGADLEYWQRKWKEKAKVILQKRKRMDLEKRGER